MKVPEALYTVHWKGGLKKNKFAELTPMVLTLYWDQNNWPSNQELKETILNHIFLLKAQKGYHANLFTKIPVYIEKV